MRGEAVGRSASGESPEIRRERDSLGGSDARVAEAVMTDWDRHSAVAPSAPRGFAGVRLTPPEVAVTIPEAPRAPSREF